MAFAPRSLKRKNVKGLALNASTPARVATSLGGDAQAPGEHGNEVQRRDTLEIGNDLKLDLQDDDLIVLKELGAGNGGTVAKVQHVETKAIMARKIIHVEAKPEVRKRIVRELGIMHNCNSPYVVSFHGAFMNNNGDVVMCMEYMNCGSLDNISKTFGPIRVDVLGKIAEAVLGGLTYLYSVHKIMHRDIKPSNILINSDGFIKLADFGVSSELENSVADTFVGTGTYMAPERIQGEAYTVRSDVWSVGLTLFELAIGKFPFAPDANATGEDAEGPQGILDLLQQIVLEPAPTLPKSNAFPQILDDMIAKCLMKSPEERPTPRELYEHDEFIRAARRTPVDLRAWAIGLLEKQQRKSHLPDNSLSTPSLPFVRQAQSTSSSMTLQPPPTTRYGVGGSPGTTPQQPPPPVAEIPMANLNLGSDNPIATRPFPARTSSVQKVRTAEPLPHQSPQIPRRPVGVSGPDSFSKEARSKFAQSHGYGNGEKRQY